MADNDHLGFFVLLAPALWFAVGWAMAYVGGWRTLALFYRATGPFDGRRWKFASASIRRLAYHHCLTFGANTRGIYMSLWLPFPFSHPPLFVPWSEIDGVECCRAFGQPMVAFQFRRTLSVAFAVPLDLARGAFEEAHGRTLPPGASALLDAGGPIREGAS